MNESAEYPRQLTRQERDWLYWLLPEDRAGYREYRRKVEKLQVIGEGGRGRGNLVLGAIGDNPDLTSPLPSVFAYGVIETEEGSVYVLTREEAGGQIEVEVVASKGDAVPGTLTERSHWTYSTWSPGDRCPCCGKPLREISISGQESNVVLALCRTDHRLWVYDRATGVNHLIPVTNFYNELMLHKQIRDPKVALDPNHLFTHLPEFSDEDLKHAFVVYNKIRTKVGSAVSIHVPARQGKTFATFLKRIFNHSR